MKDISQFGEIRSLFYEIFFIMFWELKNNFHNYEQIVSKDKNINTIGNYSLPFKLQYLAIISIDYIYIIIFTNFVFAKDLIGTRFASYKSIIWDFL